MFGNSNIYKTIRPALFQMEPEAAHQTSINMLKTGILPNFSCQHSKDPILTQNLWGLSFPNPVGLAAGFDKNAEVPGAMLNLGFGFVECGTVTPKPQHGNAKPRVFRDIENEALINRLGFPNVGMNEFKYNFEKFLMKKPRPAGIIGINIGMNKSQKEPEKDYKILMTMLGPLADYLTINISSPNTPGLRDLQKPETLQKLIEELQEHKEKTLGKHAVPLCIKLAPDLNEKEQKSIAKTLLKTKIDGIILTNTTLKRPKQLTKGFAKEKGGLSGKPLQDHSTKVISNFYNFTKGEIPIIGVGGVSCAKSAYEKIKAGAQLVQLYTGLVYEGPFVAHSINQDLCELLKKDGFSNISEAVGSAV